MNNNLKFENENSFFNNIEDNHSRTNYGAGYSNISLIKEDVNNRRNKTIKLNGDIIN